MSDLFQNFKMTRKGFFKAQKHADQQNKEQYNSEKKLDTKDLADSRRLNSKSACHFYTKPYRTI